MQYTLVYNMPSVVVFSHPHFVPNSCEGRGDGRTSLGAFFCLMTVFVESHTIIIAMLHVRRGFFTLRRCGRVTVRPAGIFSFVPRDGWVTLDAALQAAAVNPRNQLFVFPLGIKSIIFSGRLSNSAWVGRFMLARCNIELECYAVDDACHHGFPV